MPDPESPDDASGFEVRTVADIRGSVQCHYPCVPECPREHEWDNSETSQ